MTSDLPAYYSRLAPFRKRFRHGLPILTYHKLGPRPLRARLKGLYLSRKLFTQQLGELKSAGFTSIPLSQDALRVPEPNNRIVLTFDDGFCNVLEEGLGPLAETRFCALQYLVADRLGGQNDWEMAEGEVPDRLMDVGQARAWLAAGHQIGSHTCTHPSLTRLPAAKAREEITASKKKLEDTFGVPIEHFCYPYGDWNQAVRDLVAAAGYQTACTTQPGMNTAAADPFTLKRFTARYPSRNLKAIWGRLRTRLGPSQG
jgi:peptidoglycan/xylan/chitin deacetylase (PgdA/CDA1 family)